MNGNIKNYIANLSETASRKENERGIDKAGKESEQKPQLNSQIDAIGQSFSPELKNVLDYVFGTLWGANPAWRSAFKSKMEVVNYKIQLGRAMEAAGVNTMEKVEDGILIAIQQKGVFMPSTGDFVNWCKEAAEEKRARREAEERKKRIQDEKRLLSGATWAERQKAAREAIGEARDAIKGVKS